MMAGINGVVFTVYYWHCLDRMPGFTAAFNATLVVVQHSLRSTGKVLN